MAIPPIRQIDQIQNVNVIQAQAEVPEAVAKVAAAAAEVLEPDLDEALLAAWGKEAPQVPKALKEFKQTESNVNTLYLHQDDELSVGQDLIQKKPITLVSAKELSKLSVDFQKNYKMAVIKVGDLFFPLHHVGEAMRRAGANHNDPISIIVDGKIFKDIKLEKPLSKDLSAKFIQLAVAQAAALANKRTKEREDKQKKSKEKLINVLLINNNKLKFNLMRKCRKLIRKQLQKCLL